MTLKLSKRQCICHPLLPKALGGIKSEVNTETLAAPTLDGEPLHYIQLVDVHYRHSIVTCVRLYATVDMKKIRKSGLMCRLNHSLVTLYNVGLKGLCQQLTLSQTLYLQHIQDTVTTATTLVSLENR